MALNVRTVQYIFTLAINFLKALESVLSANKTSLNGNIGLFRMDLLGIAFVLLTNYCHGRTEDDCKFRKSFPNLGIRRRQYEI